MGKYGSKLSSIGFSRRCIKKAAPQSTGAINPDLTQMKNPNGTDAVNPTSGGA